ncbi:hypothetical protein ACETU7_04540 [Rhodococcus sp. 3Y1]
MAKRRSAASPAPDATPLPSFAGPSRCCTEVSSDAMPQHGTAGIAKVVEMMRAAGLGVRLELTGELDDVSPSVSLGIHRLVQESLTNVLRHAGANPRPESPCAAPTPRYYSRSSTTERRVRPSPTVREWTGRHA